MNFFVLKLTFDTANLTFSWEIFFRFSHEEISTRIFIIPIYLFSIIIRHPLHLIKRRVKLFNLQRFMISELIVFACFTHAREWKLILIINLVIIKLKFSISIKTVTGTVNFNLINLLIKLARFPLSLLLMALWAFVQIPVIFETVFKEDFE